jgi:hypothetical protein
MTDKELDNLEFVEVRVTPESMDAHLQCLDLNGYKVNKRFYLITNYILVFLLGAYAMGVFRGL